MFLSLLKYLFGYLEVSLTGYAPERFLNLCSNHNILIWNLAPTQDGYRFYISIAGFKAPFESRLSALNFCFSTGFWFFNLSNTFWT